MSETLILELVAMIITFGVGLVMNKPGYKKGKNIIDTLNKAIEDDKITADEAKNLYEMIKAKTESK
jgi:mannose/fructose/N-acetylgalactosamine-specific phosphotransferase system component IID